MKEWLVNSFNPVLLLTRQAPMEGPGNKENSSLWDCCLRAVLCLIKQFEKQSKDWTYIDLPLYSQTQMLKYALPFLLLRVGDPKNLVTKKAAMKRRCTDFLNGKWQKLFKEALEEAKSSNANAKSFLDNKRDSLTRTGTVA